MPRATATGKTDWETPQWLFNLLDDEFHFELDAAAGNDNSKCDYYISEGENALLVDWGEDTVFINPPYVRGARKMYEWVKKIVEASQKTLVVALLPCSTDTHWWHDFVLKFAEIRFVNGRLKFSGSEGSGWVLNAVCIFRPEQDRAFLGPTISARGK